MPNNLDRKGLVLSDHRAGPRFVSGSMSALSQKGNSRQNGCRHTDIRCRIYNI